MRTTIYFASIALDSPPIHGPSKRYLSTCSLFASLIALLP